MMKICRAVSKKNTCKDYAIFNMYIGKEQGQITPRDKLLIVIKRVCYFDYTL